MTKHIHVKHGYTMVVNFYPQHDLTCAEIKEFVVDALETMGGSRMPPGMTPGGPDPDSEGDLLFGPNYATVPYIGKLALHPSKTIERK